MLRLLKPLDYLRIHHREKSLFDWILPTSITIICVIAIIALPAPINVFGDDGLLSVVTGLLQILTGFYIASLAAIATFNKEGMDAVMDGVPPTLMITQRGEKVQKLLTRRTFLCLMFGYLAFMSLFIYFVGSGANLLSENARIIIPDGFHSPARIAFIALYLLLFSNLMVTTLLGLYYMADRIHRDDPKPLHDSTIQHDEAPH